MNTPTENYLGHYAGFTSRLIAYAIDLILAITGISVVWWLISTTVELLQIQKIIAVLGWTNRISGLFDSTSDLIVRGLVFIIGVGLYQIFFLTIANRTLGKMVMGLQVIPLRGGRMNFFRSFVRYLGYIVSIIPLFLGFSWILFDRRRQGWHDKIAGTCVVYTWDARPDDIFLRRGLLRLQKANEKRFGPPSQPAA